jgi:hypothetical protein
VTIIYDPHLGGSVMVQAGTLGGNTSGSSTFRGTNIVLAGGSNVTLEVSSNTVLIHGASGGTGGGGGAGTAWAITGGSITVNTSGGTISLPAYLTTAAPPGAYLTTAAQSDHSHGALSLFNLTGTSASNGLTLSAAAPGGGAAIMVSAGTTSGNVQTLRFQDSNGIGFGLNGSTVTASHNALTTTPTLDEVRNPGADAVFFMANRQVQFQWGTNWTTWTTSPSRLGLVEVDVGGNYTGTAHVDVLHIHQSVSSPVLHMIHVEAAGTNATGIHLDIAGPVAVELNAPVSYYGGSVPMILGTSQSNVVSNLNAYYHEGTRVSDLAARTHSHGNPTLALTNIAGTTASASNGLTLSLSGNAAQTVQPVAASASNGSFNFSTLKFVEGSGVTWATQVGGIQASVKTDYLTTAAQVSHSHAFATTTTNGSLINVATSGSAGVTIAVPPYLTAAAGGGGVAVAGSGASTVTSGTVQFGNLNGVSFGLNGSTMTASYNSTQFGGLNTAQSNVTWTVNSSGISLNAAGYAGTGTSATNATITLNSNGLAISVAAPGGGAAATLSRWDPCSYVTGSAYSSHAPASFFFQHLENDEPRAISYLNVVKSFGVGVPAGTSSNVSQTFRLSYSHGFTIFSRQNYGAQSTNLTTCCTGSWGASISFQHSSSNSQSLDIRWQTDSTGGTSNFGTNSAGNGWSARVLGPRLVRIPFVTTLPAGEYWIAHAHSTTAASTGNTATTIMQVSNFHIVPQLLNSNLMLMGIGTTSSSVGHLWPAAQGVASAITTNNSMAMSVISNLTVQNWYWNAGNI